MATTVFRGFYEAQKAGLITDSADIRIVLCMSGFTGATEPEAVNIDDITTVDEWDALGYTALDAANVTWSYDASSHRMYLDFDNGEGDEFGDPVAAGSEVVQGALVKLYVDGTDANDYALGYVTDGFGVNAQNGPVGISLPALGMMFEREAA